MKDASAAAVYGARAAYGVILVTTKNGKVGKTNVSYNGRFSFGETTTSTDFETRGYYSAGINDMFYKTYQGVPLYTLYPRRFTMNYGFAVMIKWKILPVHGW